MKKITLNLLIANIVILVACGFSKKKSPSFEKKFEEISDDFFVSINEVTNNEYRAFINDLKIKNKMEAYKKYYPDTTQWKTKLPNNIYGPFEKKYFWHHGLGNHPVVNISKKGAEEYCEWLSAKYNTKKGRKFNKVTFRLPTENEWNQFASVLPGHNLPWDGNSVYDTKSNCPLALINYEKDECIGTCSVGKFGPNKMGLYDIIGNVAELTKAGVIKGGSWDNTIEECMVNKTQKFHIPDPRVGFRIVMIIEEQ